MTDEDVEKIIKQNMSLQMNLAGIRADFEEAVEEAVAAEREACAKVVEDYPHWLGMTAKAEISNAIRVRGSNT